MTSSVPGGGSSATGLVQDQVTIRNVVAGVDPGELGAAGVPWANPATGSRGTVTGIAEYADGAALCRRFTVSRESYDGVNLYRGEACFGAGRGWLTRSFAPEE